MSAPKNKNNSLVLSLVAIVVGMTMLSYASVPLYRLFCQVTGYGGTTTEVTLADIPTKPSDHEITVRFNAITFDGLPWKFETKQNSIPMKVGEHKLAFFKATNLSDQPTTGMATYNVTPHKMGEYFAKIQCFCFDEQTLAPGESMDMPVSFYIDPDMLNDDDAQNVTTITLSYTFFPVKNANTQTSNEGS
ncbi:MAG: cytochrome c oxidase assembly protein [Rickettsiales bacterium]|nr:cytochrome c oxidase assembly protein [Rickettsiales bacterium]